jgi:hypothetical protein
VSISIAADAASRVIVATASGDLTLEELQEFVRTVRTGPQREWRLLFDLTAATIGLSSGQVHSLAAQVGGTLQREGPRASVAIIAPTDELYGMMRMYQILCENQGITEIGVFRSRAEAEASLLD